MGTYLLMLSRWEIILFCVLMLAIVISAVVMILQSRRRVREIRELSEDVDMIWELLYLQLEKEAEAKYKAYTTRGYANRLPERVSAISEDKELQQKLLKANSKQQRKALLKEYLPEIMFPLVICKLEGFDGLSQKEAVKLQQLMQDYGVKPLKIEVS